jgi:hypothetical protein
MIFLAFLFHSSLMYLPYVVDNVWVYLVCFCFSIDLNERIYLHHWGSVAENGVSVFLGSQKQNVQKFNGFYW